MQVRVRRIMLRRVYGIELLTWKQDNDPHQNNKMQTGRPWEKKTDGNAGENKTIAHSAYNPRWYC